MALVVQKFGGTSVADPQKILAAAQKAIARQQAGHQVVVVVSAMGHQTDVLVDLAKQISDRPSAREMDMLLSTGEQVSVALFAMAIQSLGHKAVSLTGAQIGIRTDSTHTKARIKSISTDHVKKLLGDGAIVIAAGFQGIDQNGNITTLGRGGSDTTAVALAAVLDADLCEIYTDVDGIYTTDPRMLPKARRLASISYDEMLELASLGAGVMHSRSIEFAKKFGVKVLVRSSFKDMPGTVILAAEESTPRPASGVALAKVSVVGVGMKHAEGVAGRMFTALSREKINVRMITTSEIKISVLVDRKDGAAAVQAVHHAFGLEAETAASEADLAGSHLVKSSPLDVVRRLEGMEDLAIEDCQLDSSQALVTFTDLPDTPGVAADVFEEVGRAGLNVDMIVQSHPRNGRAEISFTVPAESRDKAIEVAKKIAASRGAHVADVPHVAKLSITGVGIRSHAGVADRLFKPLADEGVNIDLVSTSEVRLNVVVAAEHGEKSLEVLRRAFGL